MLLNGGVQLFDQWRRLRLVLTSNACDVVGDRLDLFGQLIGLLISDQRLVLLIGTNRIRDRIEALSDSLVDPFSCTLSHN